MKNTLLLICFFCFAKQLSAQNSADQTWVIISYIKESAKGDYEKWMTDIFFAPMQSSSDPILKQQFSTARWQKPVRQNADKTWTYGILLDPAIPNADYGIESFLVKTYGEAKGKNYAKQYEGFMASAGQIHFFETSKGLTTPSVKEDEEAIKKVIVAEFDAIFKKGDYEAWAATMVHAPYTSSMMTPATSATAAGILVANSDFQKLSDDLKQWIKPMKPDEKSWFAIDSRDNWLIHINGDMAFAIYDEVFLLTKTGVKIKAKTQKVMERINGQWRIATTAVIGDFKNAIIPTPNPEEEAIKAVIIKQFESFRDGDFEAWSDVFIHEPYLTWSVTNGGEPGDVLTARGWEALKATMQKGFEAKAKAPKTVSTTKVTRDQWSVQIRGNVAYVTYNQHSENEEKQTKVDTTEMRILEKIKGVWKITTQASLADFKDATPPIRTKY